MRKSGLIFIIFILSFVSMSVCLAATTVIRSYTHNPVQCNKWGWIYDSVQTVWDNTCQPLEVKSLDGSKVFSIDTTISQCDDHHFADYEFNEGDDEIHFLGCHP